MHPWTWTDSLWDRFSNCVILSSSLISSMTENIWKHCRGGTAIWHGMLNGSYLYVDVQLATWRGWETHTGSSCLDIGTPSFRAVQVNLRHGCRHWAHWEAAHWNLGVPLQVWHFCSVMATAWFELPPNGPGDPWLSMWWSVGWLPAPSELHSGPCTGQWAKHLSLLFSHLNTTPSKGGLSWVA